MPEVRSKAPAVTITTCILFGIVNCLACSPNHPFGPSVTEHFSGLSRCVGMRLEIIKNTLNSNRQLVRGHVQTFLDTIRSMSQTQATLHGHVCMRLASRVPSRLGPGQMRVPLLIPLSFPFLCHHVGFMGVANMHG